MAEIFSAGFFLGLLFGIVAGLALFRVIDALQAHKAGGL